MIVYPNAKINIGLQVVAKREDGYHLLSSCFYPIPLKDCLELLPKKDFSQDQISVYGADNLGRVEDNLVLKAVRLLRKDYDFPFLDIHLYKHIPSGAGMGGGSADASFTLRAVNNLFDLAISQDKLRAYALELGADCPFFIDNVPALGEGIGELLSPIKDLNLDQYNLLIVKPKLHINTAEAFRGLKNIGAKDYSVAELIRQEPSAWRESLHNDFEDSLFPKYPILAHVKEKIYELGAVYASMTGSGAALFGLFDRVLSQEELSPFEECFIWQSK